MDEFGAQCAMLKLTHPTLSQKFPSNAPPVLSESSDIHSYEQNLWNFYLLHKRFSDIEFPPLEKAKQFLHGMDDGLIQWSCPTRSTPIGHIQVP